MEEMICPPGCRFAERGCDPRSESAKDQKRRGLSCGHGKSKTGSEGALTAESKRLYVLNLVERDEMKGLP